MENKKYYKQKIKGLQSKYNSDQYDALYNIELQGLQILAINRYKILLADTDKKTLISWTEGDLYTNELTEKNIELQLNYYEPYEILQKKIGVACF